MAWVSVGLCVIYAADWWSGSVLFVSGAIANWRQNVDDRFAVRSFGWKLFSMSGPANLAGATLVLVGVLRGL